MKSTISVWDREPSRQSPRYWPKMAESRGTMPSEARPFSIQREIKSGIAVTKSAYFSPGRKVEEKLWQNTPGTLAVSCAKCSVRCNSWQAV